VNESLEHPLIIREPVEFAQLPIIFVSHDGELCPASCYHLFLARLSISLLKYEFA
tara:strand:- start:211 stop:375 length:165 start_codon:yes stop_codon:yes gene_type:complete